MKTIFSIKYFFFKLLFLFITFSLSLHAQVNDSIFQKQSLISKLNKDTKEKFFGKQEVIFHDKNIIIKVPIFADNPAQVPIFIDASYYKDAKRIIVFADLNLIQTVLDMEVFHFIPTISMNIKIAQATPLRVAVLNQDNIWHVTTANIQSEGGGCSITPDDNDKKEFELLGKHKSFISKRTDGYKLKFSIFHPMETGLFFGKTEFYINTLQIQENDKNLVKIKLSSAISKNPRFVFGKIQGDGNYTIIMNDTDANEFIIKPKK